MSDYDAPDNDYAKTSGDDPVPVVKDSDDVESGVNAPDDFAGGENSDEQLRKILSSASPYVVYADDQSAAEKDDTDAIDESNIIEDGSERSAKPTGSLAEPGDEEVRLFSPLLLLNNADIPCSSGPSYR